MDERFRVLGEKLDRMIGTALSFDRYRFLLRKEHQDSFMIIFEAIKNWCLKVDKGLLGTVRRIGLIGFKIMMILTILRELDEPKAKEAPLTGKTYSWNALSLTSGEASRLCRLLSIIRFLSLKKCRAGKKVKKATQK